ncbi:MAG: DUF4157 domain-containing protein [Acidobacteria bacterium]|nr:DUF4157 domain-containing protein [Acidobacteriota bacterium]MBV9478397.1 DUF4157 domain-containing protein [Acidobacteriota bacterium]
MRGAVIQGFFPHGVRREPLPAHVTRLPPGGGEMLPTAVRQLMEAHFGASFQDVRVHVGGEAASIGALSFTHGSHIHFAPGAYSPSTPHGQRLLARELAHVVQQRAGRVQNPYGGGVAIVHDQHLEQEAERLASQFARNTRVAQRKVASGPSPLWHGQVIQGNWAWYSETARTEYILTKNASSKGTKLELFAKGGQDPLAWMEYSFDNDLPHAYMLHVEAYGMPSGTRAGYLLFHHFAADALEHLKLGIYIGTGVTRKSAMANLTKAQLEHNADAEAEANRNLAAVHIYESLGFDASDAEKLSKSVVTTRDLFTVSHAKMRTHWKPAESSSSSSSSNNNSKSGCFLTTACVAWRGLPDDCHELTTLRAFRDSYVRALPEGEVLIAHYYAVAPRIVAAIDASPRREAILESIDRVIRFCVDAIARGEFAHALAAYREMVLALDHPSPISARNSSSVSTGTLSDLAFSSFEPADSPATR